MEACRFPPHKKAKAQKSIENVMFVVSWDCRGDFLIDYLGKGKTISDAYYCTLLGPATLDCDYAEKS